jgi:hypothetical protein
MLLLLLLMMICCGQALRRVGMLGVSVKEDEGTDFEDGDSDTDW